MGRLESNAFAAGAAAVTPARKLVGLLALSAGAYALGVRPRMLRWGASDEEVRQSYPGFDLVPGGKRGATMAVTIDAPPSRVWPWLRSAITWREPAHWVMQTRQFANLKRRAERQPVRALESTHD